MSAKDDPLVTTAGTDRLNFAQGMLLDAQDFSDEQTYHRSRLSRSLRYLFGLGTVFGLRVDWEAAQRELVVKPGLAIDGVGRLVELTRSACVSIPAWLAAQRPEDLRESWLNDSASQSVIVADVFVRFHACERGKTPAFRSGPFDALDAVAAARVRDAYELGLVARPEAIRVRQGTLAALPRPNWGEALNTFVTQTPAELAATVAQLLDVSPSDSPPELAEHLLPAERQNIERDPTRVGRDTSAVLLARVQLPIEPITDPAQVPSLVADGTPDIDNLIRRFVYAPSALIGIVGG